MKKYIYNASYIGTLLFLSACSSPQEHARRQQCSDENNAHSVGTRIGNSGYWNCLERMENAEYLQEQMIKEKAYIELLGNRCSAFGFKQGTPEFSNCLMAQKMQDDENSFRQKVLDEQAAERGRKSLRDFNEATKPNWIPHDQCPTMLNAKPGQHPGCN